MKKILLSLVVTTGLLTSVFAQTKRHSANFYDIKCDAPAATALNTALPGGAVTGTAYTVTQVTGGIQIQGNNIAKSGYSDYLQFETYNVAGTQTNIATTTALSRHMGIRIKSTGTYTPSLTIQVKDDGAGINAKTIDHLAALTISSTMTQYNVDLNGQMHCLYGPTTGPLDSTIIRTIFISPDHGANLTNVQVAGITLLMEYFYIGDSTTVLAGTNAAQMNIASSKIYPNPVSDMAKVELELNSSSALKVTLSDVMGKEVMTITEGTYSSLSKDFSVAGLNKGIYTVNYFVNGAAAKSELLMVK